MIYQWNEKCLNFHKSAVVKGVGDHDFKKMRSNVMHVFFQHVCVPTQTASLQM